MELKFNNISLKNEKNFLINNLNLKISDNAITGIINDKENIMKKILVDRYEIEGEINLENKIIGYVNNRNFLTKTVSDEFYLIKNNIKDNDNLI